MVQCNCWSIGDWLNKYDNHSGILGAVVRIQIWRWKKILQELLLNEQNKMQNNTEDIPIM